MGIERGRSPIGLPLQRAEKGVVILTFLMITVGPTHLALTKKQPALFAEFNHLEAKQEQYRMPGYLVSISIAS